MMKYGVKITVYITSLTKFYRVVRNYSSESLNQPLFMKMKQPQMRHPLDLTTGSLSFSSLMLISNELPSARTVAMRAMFRYLW